MRSIPPTVLMYLAMMSSALCADSGRAKSVSPASLRRVFRMGSPRRDTVFDSGSPKIVVSGAPQGALVGHQLSPSAPSSGGGPRSGAGQQSGLLSAGRFGRSRRDSGQVPLSPGDVKIFAFTLMLSRNTNPWPWSVPSSKTMMRPVMVPLSASDALHVEHPDAAAAVPAALTCPAIALLDQASRVQPDSLPALCTAPDAL